MARSRRPKPVAKYGQVVLVDGQPRRMKVTKLTDAPVPKIKRRPMKGKVKIKSTVQGYEKDPMAYLAALARGQHPHTVHQAHME